VRAANAQVGIAQTNFFPQIGLTAMLGRLSVPLQDISDGSGNLWSLATIANGPIYQAGALRAQKRQAIAVWQQSRLAYEQAALSAFRDVSGALITRQKLEEIRVEQMRAVHAYEEAVAVSQQRYTYGKSSYFEVLEAQQQLFPAENALSQTELARRVVIVQLYEALGGGWKIKDAEWNGPAAPSPAQPAAQK
jgi:multidrug efflux system outer membrane protein